MKWIIKIARPKKQKINALFDPFIEVFLEEKNVYFDVVDGH
jgi:hypothetical protein